MRKLCREGRTDLKTGLKIFSPRCYVLLLILFICRENFSQVPVNGFCKYSSYDVDSGYTGIAPLNFNNDFYTDLLLFSSGSGTILTITGNSESGFSVQKEFNVPEELTNVRPLFRKSGVFGYAFVSRKKKKAGIYTFRKNGKPDLVKSQAFDSYPENISAADINGDNTNELLVSGGVFKGISLLFQEKSALKEQKLTDKSSFSAADFIDLNNDQFPDIAAYDLLNSCFRFYYNNSRGEFREARTITVPGKISSLKSFDLNLDSYEDLIFIKNKSIVIMYGDFRSSYEITQQVETRYVPDKIITGDFNKDGRIDIAYLSREESLVSVIFARDAFSFYPEILYLKKNNLTGLIPYYSRFIDGIAAVSSSGKIFIISNLRSLVQSVSLSLGASPAALSFFDYEENGITDFCFIDNYDSTFKFIIRNPAGTPAYFYSFPLSQSHSEIVNRKSNSTTGKFVCYSPGKKMIELLDIDFNRIEYARKIFYSPGPVSDLAVSLSSGKERIYIVYNRGSGAEVGIYDISGSEYTFTINNLFDKKIVESALSIDRNPSVYFWSLEDGSARLFNYNIGSGEKPSPKLMLPAEKELSVTMFSSDLFNRKNNVSISFVSGDEDAFAVVGSEKNFSVIRGENFPAGFRITDKNKLFFGETKFNGWKKLCIYFPEENAVKRVDFTKKGKNLAFVKLADTPGLSDFFIRNMSSEFYHIVYTDEDENCIAIKRIGR